MLITITNSGIQNARPTQIGENKITILNRAVYIFTIDDFTTNTTPVYSDPEGDAIAFIKIKSLPALGVLKLGGSNVLVGDLISSGDISTGNFSYESPDQNEVSLSEFQFDAADTGSNSLSGLDDGFIFLSVNAYENQPPSSIGNNTISIDYGETYVFTSEDFTSNTTPAYADPEGDVADKLKIIDLPSTGSLQFNGIDVSANQIINFSEIASGYLTYVPDLGIITNQSLDFNFAIADLGSGIFVQTT